ncbi:MAG: hypothetical protein IKC56_01215 [Clostridia bacterium]|nr:hypothetical protein [Clostridia bacterium]
MKQVKKKIKDIKSIRVLFIFDCIITIILLVSIFYLGFFSSVIYIFLSLLLMCVLLQLYLHFIPKGEVIFDASGVTIVTKKINITIYWNKVKCIYYNSFSEIFPLLNHFTIDMWLKIEEEIIDFDEKFGNIKLYKKEYLNIISFIPKHVLDVNDYLIHKS